jgi:hypothetical protein
MQLSLHLEAHRFCQNGVFPCLYDHVILGFDLDTVKMLMNMFVSHHTHQV